MDVDQPWSKHGVVSERGTVLLGADNFLRYALPLRNFHQNNPESL